VIAWDPQFKVGQMSTGAILELLVVENEIPGTTMVAFMFRESRRPLSTSRRRCPQVHLNEVSQRFTP
jgi:hypothetical protein